MSLLQTEKRDTLVAWEKKIQEKWEAGMEPVDSVASDYAQTMRRRQNKSTDTQ